MTTHQRQHFSTVATILAVFLLGAGFWAGLGYAVYVWAVR